MVLEVLPEYKFNHQLVLVSGSDCARDKINKRMVLVSLLMVLFDSFTEITMQSYCHSHRIVSNSNDNIEKRRQVPIINMKDS